MKYSELCELCITTLRSFRRGRKFFGDGSLPATPMTRRAASLSCVILRRVATKNLLLTFHCSAKESGKAESSCFTRSA